MWKIIGILILVVGALFSIPKTRDKLSPIVAAKLGPLGDKMGGPAKKWAARNEANVFLRKLAQDNSQGKEIPSPLNFQNWVKQNTKAGKRGLDPWDRPYYLIRAQRQITVGSYGPDRVRNTPDDVRVTAAIN